MNVNDEPLVPGPWSLVAFSPALPHAAAFPLRLPLARDPCPAPGPAPAAHSQCVESSPRDVRSLRISFGSRGCGPQSAPAHTTGSPRPETAEPSPEPSSPGPRANPACPAQSSGPSESAPDPQATAFRS